MEDRRTDLLLPHQRKALAFVRKTARARTSIARVSIMKCLQGAGVREGVFEQALKMTRSHARVVLHFHPERLSSRGMSAAEGLLKEGIYRSQFETGLSSGGPTAFPGGDRDLWEQRLFGGAYHVPGAALADRPKYGALEIMRHPDGPSPRFGSCYFILRPEVGHRSTFTYLGSQEDQALEQTGTLEELDPTMAALLEEVGKGKGALGVDRLGISDLLERMVRELPGPFLDPSSRPLGRALDSFIEAQVHGTISMMEDVERLVADPSFRGGPIGEILGSIASRYGFPLHWHPGFTLAVDQVPENFRGYAVRPLAVRIAGNGILDAAKIGEASNCHWREPDSWKDLGSFDDNLTRFRRLWHVMVLYGLPNPAARFRRHLAGG